MITHEILVELVNHLPLAGPALAEPVFADEEVQPGADGRQGKSHEEPGQRGADRQVPGEDPDAHAGDHGDVQGEGKGREIGGIRIHELGHCSGWGVSV